MSKESTAPEMVLVPRKPTQAMLDAAWCHALAEDAEAVWWSMIEQWEKRDAE